MSYSDNNASQLNITFDKRTSVEENFDYLLIYNHDWDVVGKYTGTELAGKTITVQGKTVRIQLYPMMAVMNGALKLPI